MHLTLYREFIECPLGHKPGWSHDGIVENLRDCFETIASQYSYTVSYTTDVSLADLVVFNLYRNYIYTNLNPILILDSNNLTNLKKSDVPVIFWHSGECHSTIMEPWFTLASSILQRDIWYVDSNYNSCAYNHLFFDSAEFFRGKVKDRFITNDDLKYKFIMVTNRSDLHKHIIYNHLNSKHGTDSYCHYLNPTPLTINYNNNFGSQNNLESFDCALPPSSSQLSEQQIGQLIGQSAVIISLNSYFTKDSNSPIGFFPLYITEKFLVDCMTNKPILPVGHCGSVAYCKNLGFDFPDWIDYSYDSILDDNKRMQAIHDEIDRLSKLDLLTLSAEFSANTNNMSFSKNYTAKANFDRIVSKILIHPLA